MGNCHEGNTEEEIRVGNFRQKNYSAEDGMNGTIGSFRRNSDCSVPNHSLEEKNAWNSVQWKKIEANPRNSVPNHSAEEKNARDSVPGTKKANSRNSDF